MKRHLLPQTLQGRILGLVALVTVVATVVSCVAAYQEQKETYLRGIDRALLAGAFGAREMFGDDFHLQVAEGERVDEAQDARNRLKISEFANGLGLQYVSGLVEVDGRFYYTVTSATEADLAANNVDAHFGEYPDVTPELKQSFADGRIRYQEHQDEWGSYRSAYVPFKLAHDDMRTYVFMADIPLDEIYAELRQTLTQIVLGGAVISLVTLLLSYLLASAVSKPMAQLAQGICDMSQNDFHLAPAARAQIESLGQASYRETRQLARSFLTMEARLQSYFVELEETAAEKQRIASDMSIARDIQMGLLRKALPQRSEVDCFATVIPAKEVGGDFFDIICLDEDRVLLTVADVSGKGIPGALFMAVTKTLLDSSRATLSAPDAMLEFINERLAAENDALMFVTMFLGVLDIRNGELRYANAGHNPPYIVHRDGTLKTLDAPHGMALGISGEAMFPAHTVRLADGETLFLFSDGVTEALDVENALYGEERLEACLCEHVGQSAGALSATVIDQVRAFAGAAPQADDITVLCVKYDPAAARRASQPAPRTLAV